METSTDKEKEMENRQDRYNFSGFTFGHSEKFYNLTIRMNNYAGYGTSYIGETSLELTDSERQALINLLMNPQETE
jgi:hypothetical protein